MSTRPEPNLRPAQRVRHYLDGLLQHGEAGGRLPTIEQMAGHLDVGISTVRTVLRDYQNAGRLETRPGRGTTLREGAGQRPLTLGVNLHPVRTHAHQLDWSERIYLGASRMAARMEVPLSLYPLLAEPGLTHEQERDRLINALPSLDLLLLFPGRMPSNYRQEIREMAEQQGKWVVFINPPTPSAAFDFASAGFFDAAYRVGQAWYASGRRRFTYIVHQWFADSVSAWHYLNGLSCGVRRDADPSVSFEVITTGGVGVEDGAKAALERLAAPGPRPDAVFCFGDRLAQGCLPVFEQAGLRVPDELSLIGGTGLLHGGPGARHIATIAQPMEAIGESAVRLLVGRRNSGGAPVPGVSLPCLVDPGQTLRPEEAALLSNPTPYVQPNLHSVSL